MAELKIKADSGGGTVSFKGPSTTTSNAAVQLTLPVDDGTANQYLKTDGSGALSWATVSSDVVGDTSPQLGGDLDVNGNQIKGDDIQLHAANDQVIAKFHKTNSSEFHFNGSKKLEVNNTGIGVTGSITPSGGIYLGGAGGGNYMDDYESGTWSPSYTASGSSHISSGDTSHMYLKIGDLMHVWGNIRTNGSASGTAAFYINSLPVTSHNQLAQHYNGTLMGDNGWSTTTSNMVCQIASNSNLIRFWKNSGASVGNITLNEIGPNANIMYSISYRCA